MRLPFWLLLPLFACVAGPLGAIDEDDLLPVDEAFALTVAASARDAVALEWKIAPGYYLYRHRTSVTTSTPDAKLGALDLPDGTPKTDEFFGKVETYRGTLTASQALVRTPPGDTLTLEVRYQGCADLGVCYPPERRVVEVSLPSEVRAAFASPADGALAAAVLGTAAPAPLGFGNDANLAADAPLPEAQAFRVEALIDPGSTVASARAAFRFTMPPGYYLYRDKTRFEAANVGAEVAAPARFGEPVFPPGQSYRDEHFGDVTVYFGEAEIVVPLRGRLDGISTLPVRVSFQGCQDGGICYPPMQRTLVLPIAAALASTAGSDAGRVRAPPAEAMGSSTSTPVTRVAASPAGAAATSTGATGIAEDSRLARSLRGQGRTLALLSFFGFGLLLAFTPCVLPMIPILSGIIAGAGPNLSTRRALLLSLVYVLASAVVFMIAGMIAGLAGANLQAAFQKPAVLIVFAAIFVALALSMFGLYELQLPSALQSRLANFSNRQRPGSLWGVAIMGALSALIVGPCVAPPLAGAVLYISQTRDAVFGGLALFLLALGMGAPLLVFGATAGRLMPRAGPWMDAVKAAFGVVFLLLAVWMLERILPPAATLFLLGAVLIGAGISLRALDPLPAESGGGLRLWKALGVLLLLLGAAQVAGSLSGARDWMRPLAAFGGGAGQSEAHLEFRAIRSVEDFERELAAASAAGKPLFLDFYADWCVACKEMDKYTFTDAGVIAAAGDFVRLKADVTANDDTDKALLKRFSLIGPPASLLFATDGNERRDLRLLGFEKPEPFRARLRAASDVPR